MKKRINYEITCSGLIPFAMKLSSASLGRPLPGGQDLGELALGVALLQLSSQAGAGVVEEMPWRV